MDDLQNTLQGSDAPNASPAKDSQQGDSTQVNPIEQQTEEEVEFNRLSGSAQDRFKSVWARAREAEEELERVRQNTQPSYVPPAPRSFAPDQKAAIETLAGFGIATDEKVDRKVDEKFNQIRWELEQNRLEGKYTGSNGEPQYVRHEVEDYIRKHPELQGYYPEDVFRYKMFPDEFENLKSGQSSQQRPAPSLRPTRAQVQTSTITPDNVEEMVKTHNQAWYDEHLDEINAAVSAHTKRFTQEGQMV